MIEARERDEKDKKTEEKISREKPEGKSQMS